MGERGIASDADQPPLERQRAVELGQAVEQGDEGVVHDVLDHAFICHEGDSLLYVLRDADASWNVVAFPYIPTAENIARWCWDQLDGPIGERFRDGLQLVEVAVWETPTSVAYYHGS